MAPLAVRSLQQLLAGAVVTIGVLGCKDLTGSPGLPAGTPAPSFYFNATGALGMRNAAIFETEQAIPQYIIDAGLLTDELEDINTGASAGQVFQNGGTVQDPLDERVLPEGTGGGATSYGKLQGIREFATQALGALATYDTAASARDSAQILRGELYAMEGYAEILLADLFCSGVPLSTLDYQKDFTYAPSSTTAQVYQAALAKLDTVLTLASASDSVMNLALVLKGRAYLDLGNYLAAADDVTAVPDGFQYQLVLNWAGGSNPFFVSTDLLNNTATISNREGFNGLPFRSSGDPRTAAIGVAFNPNTRDSLYFPAKYQAALTNAGYAPFTVASGVEARLIQAEAQLHGVTTGTGSWIDKLNALRAAAGLGTIADPGVNNPTAQIDTLFTERASWLFLDGHRQGDLRRLLRQYGTYAAFSEPQDVYPTGAYLAPGTGFYGTDVTAPIPLSEDANQYFHGCLDRDP
jgi:hypothetical protein